MNIKIDIHDNGKYERKLKAVSSWKVPESTKKEILEFIDKGKIGQVQEGKRLSDRTLSKYLSLLKHDFEIFQKQKKELKIDARVILSKSSRNTEQVKIAYTKFRYIKDEFSSPTTTFIYDDKTAIIVWSETPIATLISSKDVADSYRKYFEMLWKTAKS
jgi:hypothetical protein